MSAELTNPTFTNLQKDLPAKKLRRNLDDVGHALFHCFGEDSSLLEEISKRMRWGEEAVVLDAACGVGTAIEEITREGPFLIEDRYYVRGRIRGIGIDLNPRPDLIPREILSVHYDSCEDVLRTGEPTSPRADFRRDDLRTLATVADASVDVLYSVSGLNYVDDCLRAFEAGFRTLRDGGIMAYEVPETLISEPRMRHIIEQTPGASNVFSIRERPSDNDYRCDYGYVVGIKNPGHTFRRFPFRMIGVKKPYGHDEAEPHLKHAVVGIYEKLPEAV